MEKRWKELTDSFEVYTGTGTVYLVYEYTNMTKTVTQGEASIDKGLKEFITSKGHPVNKNKDGTYMLLIDPNKIKAKCSPFS